MGEARHEARTYEIARAHRHDGDRAGGVLQGLGRGVAGCHDEVELEPDQLVD